MGVVPGGGCCGWPRRRPCTWSAGAAGGERGGERGALQDPIVLMIVENFALKSRKQQQGVG
eukprot:scaffold102144_cov24-Tisochrysis_lutea.AAC.6